MVDDAKVQAGLAALVLGTNALQFVLPGGHLHQAGVGVAQDAVQIVHLDIGFQFDLLLAGQGAACCGGKGAHPLPALFQLGAGGSGCAVFFCRSAVGQQLCGQLLGLLPQGSAGGGKAGLFCL